MKAEEYFQMIKQSKTSDLLEVIGEVTNCLNQEIKELIAKRNVKSYEGVRAIILELNDKWNEIVSLFEKEYGYTLLERNKYKDLWRKYHPKLNL